MDALRVVGAEAGSAKWFRACDKVIGRYVRARDEVNNVTVVQVAIDVLMSVGVLAVIILLGYRVVSWARRRQTGAYVIGALLSPFIGLGNVSDPDFRITNEAKQHKKSEEDEPGDPPNLEDEAAPESATATVFTPGTLAKRRTKWPEGSWPFWRR